MSAEHHPTTRIYSADCTRCRCLSGACDDAPMALFFSPKLVGLEIKREVLQGSLASPQNALLPIIGAVGGFLVPPLLCAAINWNDPRALHGWAIASTTDIAFVVGICAMLGRAAPPAQWSCRASGFLRVGSPEAHSLTPNQSHPIILTAA
jgi:Na+:H+ antiporter, NhaA family